MRPELEPSGAEWFYRCVILTVAWSCGGVLGEWSSYFGYWSSLLFRDWIQRPGWREETGREDR